MMFEVTAAGFSGDSDDTDDRVLWINAPHETMLNEALVDTGAVLSWSFKTPIAWGRDIDFTLPGQIDEMRKALINFRDHLPTKKE